MEPLRPADPRQVGSYRLLGRLGAGGMGEVFLGESPGRRQVAVKLVRAEHAGDSRFRQRFAREVEAARKVGGFHTAPVVDADPNADPPWLVTAYIPGPSLMTAVKDNGPLPLAQVQGLGAGLAEGLAAIHACGLVHRDLKPGNIILASDGPRIIDFGVARAPDASALTMAGSLIGTIAFMSPEQVHGEHVDARSDVFSLGGVLAYAATGHGPFDAETPAAMVFRIANREPNLAAVPEPLRAVVASCLVKDPAGRPSLRELTARLADQNQAPETPGSHLPAPPPPDPVQTQGSQTWVPSAPVQTQAPMPPVQMAPVPYPPVPAVRRKRKARSAVLSVIGIVAVVIAGSLLYNSLDGGANTQQPGGTNSSASSSGNQAIPAQYVGSWEGTLHDNIGNEGDQEADLTIKQGTAGSIVGQVMYPDLGCEYNEQLVEARADEVVLHDEVVGGPCVDDYAVLSPAGGGLLNDVYTSFPNADGTPELTGQVSGGGNSSGLSR
jgi:serine/threonine protein kinase